MRTFVLSLYTILLAVAGKAARFFEAIATHLHEKREHRLREERRALEIRRNLIRQRRAAILSILTRSEVRRAKRAGRQVAFWMRRGAHATARDWAQVGLKHLSAARSYRAELQNLAA